MSRFLFGKNKNKGGEFWKKIPDFALQVLTKVQKRGKQYQKKSFNKASRVCWGSQSRR